MSQVRESLNSGLLEGDLLVSTSSDGSRAVEHVHTGAGEEGKCSADDNNPTHQPRQRCRSGNAERRGGGSQEKNEHGNAAPDEEEEEGNHDSDPPIENQNPEDGDSAFEESKHFAEDEDGIEEENENSNHKRHQFPQRKRKKSTHNSDAAYVPPYKKNRFRRQVSVLPSKFLLGGNIRDPLNLASLADAKINAEVNKVTPQSSPLPVPPHRQGPLPVFIPKNPDDPLGLAVPIGDAHGVRKAKHKKRHRRRHGRKRTDSECSTASTATDALGDEEEEEDDNGLLDQRENNTKEKRLRKSLEMGTSFETSEDEENQKKVPERTVHGDKKNSPKQMDEKHKQGSSTVSVKKVAEPVVQPMENAGKEEPKRMIQITTPTNPPKIIVDGEEKIKEVEIKEVTKAETAAAANENTKTLKNKPEANGQKESLNTEESEEIGKKSSEIYPCKSSEYVPLSSGYAPSPYIFDPLNPEETFEVRPFESPSLTNYCCSAVTPSHLMEPFSPPPRPEIPHFQRRMQMQASPRGHRHRHPELSLRRAVFQKPFNRRRFRHKSDPIVSPVIPQPGCSNRRNHHHHHNHRHGKKNDKQGNNLNTSNTSTTSNHTSNSRKGSTCKAKTINAGNNDEIKTYRPKDEIYQFGNYKQYYGYRTTPNGEDSRLWILKKEWFRKKDVLDIGCNIGHVTLSIARDFEARRVHGIDIDMNLITTARKNIKHYMIHDPSDKSVVFPHSLPMIYGALQPPSGVGSDPQEFPFNVMFSQENYVLNSDALLDTVKPEYDVIICLSVTKWIHLNYGDDGLKRFFQRMYRHLRKGGKLILEPQEWNSYYRKRKLTAKISEHYKNIKLLPDQFQDYLVNEVGFTFVRKLGAPHHAKGFQRPILIFGKEGKGDSPPSSSLENNAPTAVTTNNTDDN